MQIVPVLDIMKGEIVHAYQGQRQCYKALQSQLSPDNYWRNIIDGLLGLAPFRQLYIADLDAITGTDNNKELILNIRDYYKDIHIWLDAGSALIDYAGEERIRMILGSESFYELSTIHDWVRKYPDCILSLDFKGSEFKGNTELLNTEDIWPDNIILMQLQCVGSECGPDWSLRERFKRKDKHYFAAGGIRDYEDLQDCKVRGYAGCLIATSLHRQQISMQELKPFFSDKKSPA